ncbi:MAG TPA: GNAT family N-acetyltransferase [Bryobacteraceae bacterium]|nr:GNAT family N-acetyltransferase [Bryobacteraceae bacterium]
MEIPALETERLKLRAHQLSDFTACAAMWADPAVTRYIGGRPQTTEESWTRLLRYAGHWALLGFGYWVLEEKATGNFIGELGFADYKRSVRDWPENAPEIGWVIATQFHGRGYATEGVRAAVAWGDEHFGAGQTACIIHPENLASVRVAEKCGYRQFRLSEYKERPALVFLRSNPRELFPPFAVSP